MSSEQPPQSFEDCQSEDDARELIAQIYNNTVIAAMNEGYDPMFAAQTFRDLSGATVLELYRQQDNSVKSSAFGSDDTKSGTSQTARSSDSGGDDEHPLS